MKESTHVANLNVLHFHFYFKFSIMLVIAFYLHYNTASLYSLRIIASHCPAKVLTPFSCQRKYPPCKIYLENIAFTINIIISTFAASLHVLLYIILTVAVSGDVHPNPGSILYSDSSLSQSSHIETIDPSKHLSFVHYNVQSIANKLDLLYTELHDFDILAFSETWLSDSIATSDLFLSSYHTPERKDRIGDNHGGVILYVKDTQHYKRRNDLEIQGIECIWIELVLQTKHILFGLYYRPPNTNALQHSRIIDSIHLAVDTGISNIIVTGDFNINMLDTTSARKLHSLCQQFSLSSCISEPTHFTENSASLIDNILTSNENLIFLSGVGDPFLNQNVRYHCPIFGLINLKLNKNKTFKRHVWIFDKGDYQQLRNKALNINWNNLIHKNIDIYVKNITDSILSISKECIPFREVTIRADEPPWLTTHIKKIIRKRKRAYKKAKRTGNPSNWSAFKELRNRTVSLIREAKKAHLAKLVDNLSSQEKSSKGWWNCLKSFINPNNSSRIPPLQNGSDVISDEFCKADLLNNFFVEQTRLDESSAPRLPDISYSYPHGLDLITVLPEEVENVLKSLPLGKACGPDCINNRILRELSSQLSKPLCDLFNYSLSSSSYPDSWKEANVTPLFKSGDKSLPSNYRPISLLCSLGKVFERIVFKHTFNYISQNALLTPLQSGFIPGDSTTNQLVFLYNMFSEAVDSGKEVRAIFCDISKAFDRVWHKGLLYKLKSFGITGRLLKWFSSYLSDRKQRVVLPGAKSNWNYIHAGVPQGSILGPLLFLVYINDIVCDIGANIRLFADDTSLFVVVDDPRNSADILTSDLNKISNWANKWLVKFNPNKTESLIISRKAVRPIHPPISMQGQLIREVESHKHLGIFFSYDLRWNTHIDYILSKAYPRINVMRKVKFVLDRKSLETIYLTFIRPVLEYGDVLFDSCTRHEKDELEKVQQEAARIVTGATKLVSIQKLMDEVGWETLENRRRNHKLTTFYKMKHNLTPDFLSSLVPSTVDSTTTYHLRNADNLRVPRARTAIHDNSFLPSVVREYNSLPAQTRNAQSISSFKRCLSSDNTVPSYFYTGIRRLQVLHTRLRTNCSSLSHDLYRKNIVQSPDCACGQPETTHHFFLVCNLYNQHRIVMIETISEICTVSLNTLLYGDATLTHEQNVRVFAAVHAFIDLSKRFL